jgi:eukaryotic-like serine/threonine-protein kinase
MNFPSTPDYWIGRALGDNNRYLLNKFLGGGGMGDVFLAMDTRIGKQVALKILKANLVASKQITRRFEREIEICAALNSEHIVKVTDCGASVEGYPFYVMEYLRGQSLRQLLLSENRLSIERTINIITQICSGLQSAHKGVNLEGIGVSRGGRIQVVHRDLKPDNIFLENTDSGEFVKIVDFGIAKIRNESFEQTNLTSAFLGTFRYASPEQLKVAVDIDGRADIYSLGIIFYEMLSGTDPFDISAKAHSSIQASWVFAHTCETPKPLRSQPGCEHLPPELEMVVMRCLEKEPDKRFASVEEFNWALQSILRLNQSGCVEKIKGQIISPSPSLPVSFPQGCNEETTVGSVNIEIEENIKKKKTITQTLSKPSHFVQNNYEETIPEQKFIIQNNQAEKITQTSRRRNYVVINKSILISIIGFIAACIGSYLVISQQPLNKIKEAQNKENYKECIDLSDKFNRDSDNPEVKRIVDKCRYDYVIKLAKQKECAKANEVLENPNFPTYSSEKARKEWDKYCIVSPPF